MSSETQHPAEYTFPIFIPVSPASSKNHLETGELSQYNQPSFAMLDGSLAQDTCDYLWESGRNQDVEQLASPSVKRPECTSVWGTSFSQVDMHQAVELADRIIQARRPEYFVTANLNYLMLVDRHPRLVEVNEQSACILADGFPVVLRSKLSSAKLPCRVAGADLIIELARLAAEKAYRVFFLGGAPGVAQTAANRLVAQFPKLQVAGVCSPPFRALNMQEQADLVETIQAARADILLVAFGQPKGELWVYDHFRQLGVPLSIQLGASFDFLAGTARRAPWFWQVVGCEWLYRTIRDPRRLVPRYASNLAFLLRLLMKDVKEWAEHTAVRPS